MLFPFDQPLGAASPGRGPAIVDIRQCAPIADDDPTASRQLGGTGDTRFSFTIDREGGLGAFGVVRPCGFLRLDHTVPIKRVSRRSSPGVAADGTPVSASCEVEYGCALQ